MSIEKIIEPDELEFEKPSSNCKDYSKIGTALKGGGYVYYYFTADEEKQLQGAGISELQRKLAYVLRYKAEDFYFRMYGNKDTRKELTCGIYGPQTTVAVMTFQKNFMDDTFNKAKYSYAKGFGTFGPNTKKKLDELYEEVKNSDEAKNNVSKPKGNIFTSQEFNSWNLELLKSTYKDKEGYY